MSSLIKVYTVLSISLDTFNAIIKTCLILLVSINGIKIALLSHGIDLSELFILADRDEKCVIFQ